MKKNGKKTLGLLCACVSACALAGCHDVTAKDGVILTLTVDGKRVDYTAKELLESYETGSGSASTSFDTVYEVLVRNYYNSDAVSAQEKSTIEREAEQQVNAIRAQATTNASANGTSYETEFEKLLDSNGVDNIYELRSKKMYEVEKSRFEKKFYDDNTEAIRDGVKADGTPIFPDYDDPSKAFDKGWLKDRMPYHVSHILAKVDASSDLTQGQISADDAKQIATIILELAGVNVSIEKASAPVMTVLTKETRQSFGQIAFSGVNDDTSKTSYGDLGIMDKTTSFVNEFKLGVYAYDAIYNQANGASATDYRKGNRTSLLPSEDKTFGADKSSVLDYFENKGIGTIPVGAAVALARTAYIEDNHGLQVNNGSATYYPRNIIFNKYFNKHNIAVITPDEIPYNQAVTDAELYGTASSANADAIAAYNDEGTANSTYAAYPGFQKDTTALINESSSSRIKSGENVLTDKEGRIVLAVRAGTSDYQGIHFIVVDRSALDEFGSVAEEGKASQEAATSAKNATLSTSTHSVYSSNRVDLNDYYTVYAAGNSTDYPSYQNGSDSLADATTYNNFIVRDSAELLSRATSLKTTITGYNSNISTYLFQSLENGLSGAKITFADDAQWLKDQIDLYITTKRESTTRSAVETFDDAWANYATALSVQDYVREAGKDTGKGKLLSETCAIGYTSSDAMNRTGLFVKGGPCGTNND